MSKKVDLKVDFCSHQAAKYAVEHWHYSRVMPAGKAVKVGVWENDVFVGCVLYGRGANNNIGKPYGLKQTGVCELTRVALDMHISPVSQIVTSAKKLLRRTSPLLRLIVSYADPEQDHYGGIYQAMNWVYVGVIGKEPSIKNIQTGEVFHRRTMHSRYGQLKRIPFHWGYTDSECKHKYLYPLDRAMRRQIEPLAKPYPKRADVVLNGNMASDQLADAGSIPAVRS